MTLGDKLINEDGKFVNIRNLQRYQKEDETIYELKPYGSFRSTQFTGEHPIWIHGKGFVHTKDVTTNDWLEIPNIYHRDL